MEKKYSQLSKHEQLSSIFHKEQYNIITIILHFGGIRNVDEPKFETRA